MPGLEGVKTRHTEYSLVLPVAALLVLWQWGATQSLLAVIGINLLALIAILSSAFSVVRHADVLAHRLGEPYGSLILSLSVVILEVSLISALMATGDAAPALMRDTLFSIIMIVTCGLVGFALLLGGRKFATQYVNLGGIKQYLIAIFPLSIIVLVFPMAMPGGNFTHGQALLVAAISAAMYGVFLLIQTKTHQSLFVYEHEDEDDDGDPHHGKPSAHSSLWHTLWLLVHLIAVISVTKMNASPLEHLLSALNAPEQFTGFLVALLILSPEGLGAIKAVLVNQTQRAMNLFFGSVLATISLTVPAVTLIATLTGHQLIFALDAPQMVVMLAALVLCQISFSTGRTNVLNGAAHLALFVAYLMTILL
ncbi:sodium-potassium/proton antiporter ChaA [Erwinia sp. OLTSP20]|uniref:sodium-potassium/proton antiporter ChaA n=1 Tax=unclassified Erwinia TaxID=2622719 RepID=UPI000C19B86A|nr:MULTISPECIES: sodium-potassium/proton antiporter ChaA [unclassified Erwinia]PIJ49969.1 sodium-potassium/proton antiporter ChaA [Erwinia sp. OAMSP11]PIJ71383.1 sodium-potassium/proton antiporter ChaA [Erwinia sp. OLSSP12]PIJ80618.1 sodium-potassium/proton antiporter ChaA [Erwinia sp. OLCASP19]PIJ82786.1 sodium-potassium/proton antiporter ChaA [Erwinia sp. OLMTSP26]PIJ85471.1 sodium-potassium/proton antiporter ChaA [Erwinia sp. OLMDSP33]